MSILFERVLADAGFSGPTFRERAQGGLEERLTELACRKGWRRSSRDPKTAAAITAFQRSFSYPRHHYDLPALLQTPVDIAYKVHNQDIKLIEQGGRYGLVKAGSRQAVEVPSDVAEMVELGAESGNNFRGAIWTMPSLNVPQALNSTSCLTDLGTMRLTETM